MALTENQILDIVYALYEGDDDGWETTSDEYLAGRKYCNAAINRWEHYDNTEWRDLFSTLTAAADGDKTTTAGDYSYDCPTNMVRPASWVRTGEQFWEVIPPEKVPQYTDTKAYWCYFTGNVKDGFDLNFNPEINLTTGTTIYYEYYKAATTFDDASDTTEMPDPYFIVYFVLARFLKNDGEDNSEELQEADDRLETMRVANMSGYYSIDDNIDAAATRTAGFGE